MLSYQHIYHAGNLADVHKHAALAWVLSYMTRKDKPLSYLETHAGRGLYDLSAEAALKTGEAAQGIARAEAQFSPEHPYAQAVKAIRAAHGATRYPGSPVLAHHVLRPSDTLHLAELHPAEHSALRAALPARNVHIRKQDGYEMAISLCPPTPRRGVLLIDPSYEQRSEYGQLPGHVSTIARKWNVGVVMIWYPVLRDPAHGPMLSALSAAHPEALRHEVRFPPAREGHRMEGSGLFVINPPFGLSEALDEVTQAIHKAVA